ncbi:MAG: YihY/virulence factor BrkB family protein [Candidatus Omnitrophica bacterium]|nr:YihY/virulence factor BrkB family protein [Candidatus Omnitrophota bacterium]
MIQKIKQFLTVDIWRMRLKTLPRSRSILINSLRIILLALRGFAEDKCMLRASALTFFSLLSIVPVVAMAFGIAKGFGFEKILEAQLIEKFQGQEEVVGRVIEFAQAFLENTKGGLIAGIGIVLLFWTVIKVLGNIEYSFNDIWGIKTPRTLIRRFSDYLAIMLICPILLILSSSITVFVTSQVALVTEKIALLGAFSSLIMIMVNIIPYGVLWLLFSFIYIVMPNTKVKFSSGIFAGIIAGTIYQVVQWVYVAFQVGASKYGAIYGSFAALPLFLVWLQMSWLIVLFGGELSFAHQNVETYEFEPDCLRVSYAFKRLVSLRVVHTVVKQFTAGEKPMTASQLSHALEIPIRLLQQILFELIASGILVEVKQDDERMTAYQPARDSAVLTIQYVIEALDSRGSDLLPIHQSFELKQLDAALQTFSQAIATSPANLLLRDL